jgi:hypothetical protein
MSYGVEKYFDKVSPLIPFVLAMTIPTNSFAGITGRRTLVRLTTELDSEHLIILLNVFEYG